MRGRTILLPCGAQHLRCQHVRTTMQDCQLQESFIGLCLAA